MEPTFLGTSGHPVPTVPHPEMRSLQVRRHHRRQQRQRAHVAAASLVDDIVWDAFIAAEVLAPTRSRPA